MQTLEVAYFAAFAGGASFAGVGWLVSHGHAHAGGKATVHAHGIAAALNLGVLACGASSGGAAGLIAIALGGGTGLSVVAAVAGALLGGAAVARVFGWLSRGSVFQEEAHPAIATSLTSFAGQRVGEVVWILNGVRRPLPARSDDGAPIERGTEVVVLAVERGIARVVPCARWFGEEHRHGHQD